MNFTNKAFLFLLIFLFGVEVESYGQRFFSLVFDNLPQDMQLYARDDNNIAEIPVSGIIEIGGWDHISVVTYRNKERFRYDKSVLAYGGKTSASFSMKSEIKAEMADYDFEVYACKQTDSVLIVKRTEVVAGDFYVISGQSNAAAGITGDWSSKYARTIARYPDGNPEITPGDTLWIPAAWSWTYVGAWGLQLQRSILEKYGIPTCVINGSLPGANIKLFLDRNETKPADPNNLYGLLLTRVNKARPTRIRNFFWYQGEQEAIEGLPDYDKSFDKLFKYWQIDYPKVDEFIILQINVFWTPAAGEIRDFQRRTKYLYPKTETFSTLGMPLYTDGIHYLIDGYQMLGKRLFQFLAPRYYGETDSTDVSCPDIKRAFYSSPQKNEITLVFDEGQNLKWPADTVMKGENGSSVTVSTRNFFFLDGNNSKPASIKSGVANGNRIILSLTEPVTAKTINYVPVVRPENVSVLLGPYIKNSRGLGAFSFNNLTIGDALLLSSLTSTQSGMSALVEWPLVSGATSYVLERKTGLDVFEKIKEFDEKTVSYLDADVVVDKTYTYRIQALSSISESQKLESSLTIVPILALEPRNKNDLMNVYPNPVTDQVNVQFKNASSGILQIVNKQGQNLFNDRIFSKNEYSINATLLPAGTYIVSLRNENGDVISQKIVK